MNCHCEVRFWETGVKTIGQHCLCTLDDFFCRLRDHDQRAAPLLLVRGHPCSRANPRGHVQIMAACMHHRCAFGGTNLAGKRKPGLLFHRESVSVSPQQNIWTVAIPEHSHHAVTPDARGNLVP